METCMSLGVLLNHKQTQTTNKEQTYMLCLKKRPTLSFDATSLRLLQYAQRWARKKNKLATKMHTVILKYYLA